MNLRQEITTGAKAFDTDTSPTCPHLSFNPEVRGKQIRAVALDRIVGQALLLNEVPTFNLDERGENDPKSYLASEAADFLFEDCREIMRSEESDLADIYTDSFDIGGEDEVDNWALPHIAQFTAANHIGRFIKSGVDFSISLINLAQIALPYEVPYLLYEDLKTSYAGCVKKFTGGKSIFDLDFANSGIEMNPSNLTSYVIRETGSLRLKPGIINEASETIPPLSRRIHISNRDTDDRSAVCPASIEVHDDRPVVTDKVWQWTVEVAQKSRLIEVVRELQAA